MHHMDILSDFYLYIDGRGFELPAVWRVLYDEYNDEAGYKTTEVRKVELLSWGERYSRSRAQAILMTDDGEAEVKRQENIVANNFDPSIWL